MSKFNMPSVMARTVRPSSAAIDAHRALTTMKQKAMIQECVDKTLEEQEERYRKSMTQMGYYTFDLVFQACLLTLIDDFHWGTHEREGVKSRIRRLHDGMMAYIGEYDARYDDHLSAGLTEQLRQRGLAYHSAEMQHKEEWL